MTEETYEEKKQKEVDEVASHNYHFMQRYKPLMETWKKTHHASEKPPVYKDTDGKYYWANRKQRRAQNLR